MAEKKENFITYTVQNNSALNLLSQRNEQLTSIIITTYSPNL
jgi:hypothetical protein